MSSPSGDRAKYDVKLLKNVRVPMRDGVELAADIFLPESASPVPAILEYLPYRKDDVSASSNQPHAYFAERGFASVRLDIRGTGASPGISVDEITEQEQEDGYDACSWLVKQEWCTGALGAFGTSYGGYSSCYLAANRAPGLRAIVPMDGFDERYSDSDHYSGGQLRTHDFGRYGNLMLARNALPPHPDVVGAEWAQIWLEHLEQGEPWMLKWVRHQTDDAYWSTMSIRDRFGDIECAVMMIGGWRDGYISQLLRMYPELHCPKRAIIGPWAHARPDGGMIGPHIDWLAEALRWWNQWLKGDDAGVLEEPPVILYVQQYDTPKTNQPHISGYWRSEPALPISTAEAATLNLADGRLTEEPTPEERRDELVYRATTGIAGGEFQGGGLKAYGLPLDQRLDEPFSLVYTSEPLTEALEIIGRPRVVLHVSSTARIALFCAKLCAVAPDGTSALVCKGSLNATRRESLKEPSPLVPGAIYELTIELDGTAWRFDPGFRIRLDISNSDFPDLWPTPELATSTVFCGGEHPSRLELPKVPIGEPSADYQPFAPGAPTQLPGIQVTHTATAQDIVRHVLDDSVEVRYGFVDDATFPHRMSLLVHADFAIRTSDANPAMTRHSGRVSITLSNSLWSVEAIGDSTIASTATTFTATQVQTVYLDGTLFFHKSWTESVPRLLM